MSFDATQCQLWLDTLTDASGGSQPLCEEHATRITPPRGWVVVDRRAAQSSLVTAPADAPPARAPRRQATSERQWGRFEAPALQFDFDAAAAVEQQPVAVVVPDSPPVPEPEAESEPEVADVVPEPEPEPSPKPEPEPAPQPDAATTPPASKPPRAGSTLSGAKGRLLSRAFEASGVDEELSRKFFGAESDQDS